MKDAGPLWRWLGYAAWAATALWIARIAVLPAPLRGVRLSGLSGDGPYYAELRWDYGLGARPQSVIFDFAAGSASGSCTTDGDAVEAEIPLGVLPGGPYSLTASATYRIFGRPHTVVTRAEGVTLASLAG